MNQEDHEKQIQTIHNISLAIIRRVTMDTFCFRSEAEANFYFLSIKKIGETINKIRNEEASKTLESSKTSETTKPLETSKSDSHLNLSVQQMPIKKKRGRPSKRLIDDELLGQTPNFIQNKLVLDLYFYSNEKEIFFLMNDETNRLFAQASKIWTKKSHYEFILEQQLNRVFISYLKTSFLMNHLNDDKSLLFLIDITALYHLLSIDYEIQFINRSKRFDVTLDVLCENLTEIKCASFISNKNRYILFILPNKNYISSFNNSDGLLMSQETSNCHRYQYIQQEENPSIYQTQSESQVLPFKKRLLKKLHILSDKLDKQYHETTYHDNEENDILSSDVDCDISKLPYLMTPTIDEIYHASDYL